MPLSFGPDPYLNGEGAFYTITGIQSVGVMACAKHLVANNQEHWRYGLSAIVDDRTMHEMYWYPFLRSIEVRRVSFLPLIKLGLTPILILPSIPS
jgi:beta-glucosidase